MAKKLCWMHPPPMEPPPSPPGRGAIQQQVHCTCYLLDGDGMSNTMLLLGEVLLAIQARKDRKGMSSITRYVLPAPSPKSPHTAGTWEHELRIQITGRYTSGYEPRE